jgi:GNAT superfamily N-acetyltransferase
VIDDVSVAIEQVGDDDASLEWWLEHLVLLDPRNRGMTVASMRRFERSTGPWRLLVARVVEEVVGVASAMRKPHEPESPTLLVGLIVEPEARGLGIGSRLYDEVLAWAKHQHEQPRLRIRVPEDDERSVAWWMRRGLEVEERHVITRLDLTDESVVPEIEAPDGIDLTTLADRSDLEHAAHAMLCEALADIPGESFAPPTFDEWIELIRVGERPAASIYLALEGEVVVGICTTSGSTADTDNHADNAPMRAINQRMGFVDEPAQLVLAGEPNEHGTSTSRGES